MATFLDNGPQIRIGYDASDDVQVVRLTREEARAYFDSGTLPESFDTGLDLAQAEATTMDAIVVIIIAKEDGE
jgi:hypothetical protein